MDEIWIDPQWDSDIGSSGCRCGAGGVCGGWGRWMEVGGWGGVEGSVTDSHLVPVARAARVVPLSAVVFDGLSCLSGFYLKPEHLKAAIQSLIHTSQGTMVG